MTPRAPELSDPPATASSERVRLARLALAAALTVPDVVRGETGPGVPRVTSDASGLLAGVSATAQADGRYAIELRLVARLVPLPALAEDVRARVHAAAAAAGLAAALGGVDVEFADVHTAEDTSLRAEPATDASA